MLNKAKWFVVSVWATVVSTLSTSMAYAQTNSTITNPLSGNTSTVGGVTNSALSWILGATAAVSGSWFLFHLYKAIWGFMQGSNHAQKREEAKSHLVHVAISGVMLGAAGVVAGALYNLGGTFH